MRFLQSYGNRARRVYLLVAIALLLGAICPEYAQAKANLVVSAAASLKEALLDAEASYSQGHADVGFSNNFGSSGTLAAQIDQGAPVDVFLSASAKQMDDLTAKSLVVSETRRNLLSNTLVLIAQLDSALKDFQGLTAKSIRTIAFGDPASVPAGQYGRQTLQTLHLWDSLDGKLVLAKDVRQVLTYVETGNADAGIVYATDAHSSTKVRVVATAPESSHDPILYPVAVIKGSRNEDAARAFVKYLSSSSALSIFRKHGFMLAPQ